MGIRRLVSVPDANTERGGAPDDPGIWTSVVQMWPTEFGSYRTCDIYAAASGITATGETAGSQKYAFAAATPSGTVGFVVGAKIWEVTSAGGILTDRTGGVTIGTKPMMAQYGAVTVCVMGAANATVSANGGNFAALGGAPKGEIVLVCAGAVLIFNTDTSGDGWAASDVGDHTNWTTGEAASGRLLQTPGQIIAAVAHDNVVIVFKAGSIYRGTYVGGVIKWAWEVVSWHSGIGGNSTSYKYSAVSCPAGVVHQGSVPSGSATPARIMLYANGGIPQPIGNDIAYFSGTLPVFTFAPDLNMVSIVDQATSGATTYFYSFDSDRWGFGSNLSGAFAVVQGNQQDAARHYSASALHRPVGWRATTDTLTMRAAKAATLSGAAPISSVTSSLIGRTDRLTSISKVIPLLRRRSNTVGGTPSAALQYTTYTERHGGTAVGPTSVSEAGNRNRFDFTVTAIYTQVTITFTDMAVDIDDILVPQQDGGAN